MQWCVWCTDRKCNGSKSKWKTRLDQESSHHSHCWLSSRLSDVWQKPPTQTTGNQYPHPDLKIRHRKATGKQTLSESDSQYQTQNRTRMSREATLQYFSQSGMFSYRFLCHAFPDNSQKSNCTSAKTSERKWKPAKRQSFPLSKAFLDCSHTEMTQTHTHTHRRKTLT